MKIVIRIIAMIALLVTGFAVGFPIGQSRGFSTGSEWAIVQAKIIARESGLFMPVNFEAGHFRIILKQPKHLYTSAWMLADRYENKMTYVCSGDRTLNERVQLIQHASLLE
jgi:hypothetical protein